jgi:hypothetical protein
MITVAEVMKETSFCHLGKGRKTIVPTPKAKRMLNQGTPASRVCRRRRG